ncbi:heparin lyase I family protein [Caenimonas terrae]|uniref:Heparin lyase I family protein n=1 Tax=Caenimonas terrae TaxID=696074 RepID=A0ABW0NEG0_9BURK
MDKTTSSALALALALAMVLAGCGGGGSTDTAAPAGTAPAVAAAVAAAGVTGTTCATSTNTDVFGGLAFQTSHRINARDDGCLIVRGDAGHPVFDGEQSARFEVRPGDCSATSSYDDCTQDRSRHEINETTQAPTNGRTLVYTAHVFIPPQERFKPHGKNTLFLTQINFVDSGDVYGTLAYLEVADNGDLLVRSDSGFTFGIEKQYPVYANPVGKWIKLTWEIRSSAGPDGSLRVYVDDVLKVDESRPTLPSASAANRLRIGIYNVFVSKATEPYADQVVYFDGISKSIR